MNYTLRAVSTSTNESITTVFVPSEWHTYTLRGLSGGVLYELSVSAANVAGYVHRAVWRSERCLRHARARTHSHTRLTPDSFYCVSFLFCSFLFRACVPRCCCACRCVVFPHRPSPFSPSVNVSTLVVTAPAPPTAPTVVNTTSASSVLLSLPVPPSWGGVYTSLRYQVWTTPLAPGGAVTSQVVQASSSVDPTLVRVTGLLAGSGYTFAASAGSSVGTSAPGASVSAVTAAASRPGAVSDVGVAVSASALTVTWVAPLDTGGVRVLGYRVAASPVAADGSGAGSVVTAVASGEATTMVLRHLPAATNFSVAVTAFNEVGFGAVSATATVVASTAHAVPPGPPQHVVVSVVSATSVAVSWEVPADTGGAAVDLYMVDVAPIGGVASGTARAVNVTVGTTVTVAGLTTATAYTANVTAVSTVAGRGATASAPDTVTTGASVLSPSCPTNVVVANISAGTADITWASPSSSGGDAITSYTVILDGGSGSGTGAGQVEGGLDVDVDVDVGVFTVGASAVSATLYRLHAGVAYGVVVRAVNGAGPSVNCTRVAFVTATNVTAPGSPTAVTVTNTSSSTADVQWRAPVDSGGTAIVAYHVECITSSGDGAAANATRCGTVVPNVSAQSPALVSGAAATVTPHNVTATIRGLVANTTYAFRVRAVNAAPSSQDHNATVAEGAFAGLGAPSAPSATSTTSPVVAAPAPPTTFAVAGGGGDWLAFSWGASASTGGAAGLLRYELVVWVYLAGPDTSPNHTVTVSTTTLGATVTNLLANRFYRAQLTTLGGSEAQPLSSATLQTSLIQTANPTPPSVVSDVNATGLSGGRMAVTCVLPATTGGAPLDAFTVTTAVVAPHGHTSADSMELFAVTRTPFVLVPPAVGVDTGARRNVSVQVPGLVALTTYRVTVTAHTQQGDGPVVLASVATAATLSATAPTAPPQPFVVAATGHSLTVTWTLPSSDGGASLSSFSLYVQSGSGVTCMSHNCSVVEVLATDVTYSLDNRNATVVLANLVARTGYAHTARCLFLPLVVVCCGADMPCAH